MMNYRADNQVALRHVLLWKSSKLVLLLKERVRQKWVKKLCGGKIVVGGFIGISYVWPDYL